MAVRPIKGFPLDDDFGSTRVPNAVLGRVLASVDDVNALKLILRAIWLLERQRGYPKFISSEDLRHDRVLATVFGESESLERSLENVIRSGVLVEIPINGEARLMLNTVSAQRVTFDDRSASRSEPTNTDDGGWDSPAVASGMANAFQAYEENIGALTPMIRESILSALEDFTDEDISRAIRIAVENESRSWSFVAGVLRRWTREGIPHEPRDGTTGEADAGRVPEAELRRYLEQQRKRDRARSA